MTSFSELFVLANQHYAAGNWQYAEQLLHDVLHQVPQYAEARHLLGVIAYQTGRHALAAEEIASAVQLSPWMGNFHCNLGLAYEALGRDDHHPAARDDREHDDDQDCAVTGGHRLAPVAGAVVEPVAVEDVGLVEPAPVVPEVEGAATV